MEMRQLQNFIIVAREGGITAAARKANITQPALSRQVKQLEEELGTPLLERSAHSVKLTPAGEMFANEAARILAALDAMVARVRSMDGGVEVRIGYAPSLAANILGPAIERFRQIHPNARVSLFDQSSAEMRGALAEGRLDAIIGVPGDPGATSIEWQRICLHPWRIALPASHPAAGKEVVTFADIAGTPLLMFGRESYPDYWRRVTEHFKRHKWNAKVGGEFDSVTSLGAAVEANLGVALVAGGSRLGNPERIRLLELDPAPEPIEVAVGRCAEREPNPVVDVFIAELKAAAKTG